MKALSLASKEFTYSCMMIIIVTACDDCFLCTFSILRHLKSWIIMIYVKLTMIFELVVKTNIWPPFH